MAPILVVEDDENDAALLRMAFERATVRNPLKLVGNGQEAVAYLSGQGEYADRLQYPRPCLLITDLKMPKLTGFDLLAWLEKQARPNRVPAIVLSGSAEDNDRKRALELGARDYWVKPASLPELVELACKLKDTWLASPSLNS